MEIPNMDRPHNSSSKCKGWDFKCRQIANNSNNSQCLNNRCSNLRFKYNNSYKVNHSFKDSNSFKDNHNFKLCNNSKINNRCKLLSINNSNTKRNRLPKMCFYEIIIIY